MEKRFSTTIGGKEFIIETGRMAKQAGGAVTVQLGGTVVLVTAVCSKEAKEDIIDMIPLWVEYQERTYAAGKIPGGFFKREGRPSEKAILTARLIDRPIRPLFPKGLLNEVQVMAMVLSADGENDPDCLAVIGASAALSISDVPFNGPIGGLRIGRIDNEFIVNPTFQDLENSSLDVVVVGNKTGVCMIEANSKEVSEEAIQDAIQFGHQNLLKLITLQEEMVKSCGKQKCEVTIRTVDPDLLKKVEAEAASRICEIYKLSQKDERVEAFNALSQDVLAKLVTPESGIAERDVKTALTALEKEIVRNLIVNDGRRVDGRSSKDLRPISCEVGFLPRTHGSGLFTRGQTQSLSVTTLGTSADEQMIDALEGEGYKNFMLHYNFPPFSVGEVKPVRGPGRREIGHGALAERSLKAVMPTQEEFPYTVRVVSDILESNGSSSMATVCAGTLALMDAGVPIKAPVSGIAIGLVKEGKKFVVLTDIGGVEDHFGDMDFKVAGTKAGITAIQMDLKIDGIDEQIIKQAMKQARESRLQILDKMLAVIAKPKEQLSQYAPRIVMLKIKPDKVREVIGPGGKVIKKIIEETGASIDIEDDGTVQVASADPVQLDKAVNTIKDITAEAEVGKIYKGKVKRIMDFGAFCEILPGKEGLIHISELSNKYVKKVEDEVKIGDEVVVKVIEIDELGRVNLSRKQAAGEKDGKKK